MRMSYCSDCTERSADETRNVTFLGELCLLAERLKSEHTFQKYVENLYYFEKQYNELDIMSK